ncbi:MAG TPA: hypothetical protein VN445_14110 [Rectinemataceae bacterium]|nr:hypothetical protein [Rectinemataceae bacterium]
MRLCVPSWQLPGSWLYNVEKLAAIPWIEGIELLFFSFDEDARKTFAVEREGIAGFADRFSFSLHLPDPLMPADRDLVAMTETFVDQYVFHPYGAGDRAGYGAVDEADRALKRGEGMDAWADLLKKLRAEYGERRFAMEYSGGAAFERSLALLPGAPLCADTGCLIRDGLQPLDWMLNHVDSLREVHLHAARGDKDHLPLGRDEPWVPEFVDAAAAGDWRVVLETFSLEDSRASYEALRRWLP